MKKLGFICIALSGLFSQSAIADFMGLANGRSANMDNLADMSVGAGINAGGDGNLLGVRFNFKASGDLMLFGDFGRLAHEEGNVDGDGLVYGLGGFYQLRNVDLLENTDLAVKGAYHLGTLETKIGSVDVDTSEITVSALISGDQLGDTDFGWYGNAGVHIIKFDGPGGSDTDNEIGLGGGVTGSVSVGEIYAGIDFIDGAIFVAGVRYNL